MQRNMVRKRYKVKKGRQAAAVLFALFATMGSVAAFHIISIRAGYAEDENLLAVLHIKALRL